MSGAGGHANRQAGRQAGREAVRLAGCACVPPPPPPPPLWLVRTCPLRAHLCAVRSTVGWEDLASNPITSRHVSRHASPEAGGRGVSCVGGGSAQGRAHADRIVWVAPPDCTFNRSCTHGTPRTPVHPCSLPPTQPHTHPACCSPTSQRPSPCSPSNQWPPTTVRTTAHHGTWGARVREGGGVGFSRRRAPGPGWRGEAGTSKALPNPPTPSPAPPPSHPPP